MQIDNTLLIKLEKLSFLEIADSKRDEVISQLSEIVNFVDNLSELDTNKIDSNFAMDDKATFTREDIPSCNKEINESILNNAPLSGDSFFIVPKIIE